MRGVLALSFALPLLAGCRGGDITRFPLREPIWVDDDTKPVHVACRPDPEAETDKEKAGHMLCMPEEYESPFGWDMADNTVFRPLARLFAFDPGGEAVNVNSVDEVPDSSWFTNRIGKTPMSIDELARGSCEGEILDPSAADGEWLIDMGKPNGANPGFRIRTKRGSKFMLKADIAEQPERATAATSIASRLYHAAGWWAPCDSVVYLRRSLLKLKPGLEYADNSGIKRPFTSETLDGLLEKASKRGDLIRMVASQWLPGRTIGPFRYEGTRADDPNDVIPHEDRRDLRGARVIAAWLNHFDSREQNSMDVWLAADKDKDDKEASPGHVRHYYIDLGDCFGSEWDWDDISRRLGHAHYLDLGYMAEDFITLGIIERPWDRAEKSKEGDIFGYFSARDFKPDIWRGGYPNPTFARMTELDGAWAARVIARFTPAQVEAAVRVGDFTKERHTRFLIDQLLLRQQAILQRYLSVLSPIADIRVSGKDELCGLDLARARGLAKSFRYTARLYAGEELTPGPTPLVRPSADGSVCISLPHAADDGGAPDAAPSRYVVVDLQNGFAKGPLRAHLYDLGPSRGFRLAGVERPSSADPPG